MKRFGQLFKLLFCCFLVIAGIAPVAAKETPSKPSTETPQPDPKANMAAAQAALNRLLPIVWQGDPTPSSMESDNFQNALKDFVTATQALHKNRRKIPRDPFNQMIVNGLYEDSEHALNLSSAGQFTAARQVVRTLTGYCVGCHTATTSNRADQSRSLNFPDVSIGSLASLSVFDKATYLAAIRRFDEALLLYEQGLVEFSRPEKSISAADAQAWHLAVQRMLAIIVRVYDDPFLALELISRIRESGSVPAQLQKSSALWRQAVKEWAKEKEQRATISTIEALLLAAKNTESGLIQYLRASRLVNEQLSNRNIADADLQKLLWAGGQAAEALHDVNFWTLEIPYYEACARIRPGNAQASACKAKLVALGAPAQKSLLRINARNSGLK